jgi:hypothetical protein
LRIPDKGKHYPLPPGLGSFSLKHLEDYADRIPADWRERGGVMMPLYPGRGDVAVILWDAPAGMPIPSR